MFIRNQWGMSISWNGIWLKYGQQPAELHWSIDRSVTRLFYCMSQSKHFEHFLWCVFLWYVTVMTFKAYTTAVMNKLTYVSFHEVGWEQPSGEVVSFVAYLLKYLCAKNYEKIMRFNKVIAKIIRVQFFASQCRSQLIKIFDAALQDALTRSQGS